MVPLMITWNMVSLLSIWMNLMVIHFSRIYIALPHRTILKEKLDTEVNLIKYFINMGEYQMTYNDLINICTDILLWKEAVDI